MATKAADPLSRENVEKLCGKLMIFAPSAEIYGGAAGLYDMGPHGAAILNNICQEWRRHFVHAEEMLEIKTAIMTPHPVLKASGHVDRFSDLMVKDTVTGKPKRADHLLEEVIEDLLEKNPGMPEAERKKHRTILNQADAYSPEELGVKLKEYGAKFPETGNDITDPFEFKLMFQTQFGPEAGKIVYLRPETAQGMFVNFKALLEYNADKLPLAACQIGTSFRNEISPRNGLIRTREFIQGEIEHFFNPAHPDHPKFPTVQDVKIPFFSQKLQLSDQKPEVCTIGEAVQRGMVGGQTLGYFIARTYLFMAKVGMDMSRVRFRQHLPDEMAHYASDCWDCEVEIFGKWVEAVGIANRGDYDLLQHIKKSKKNLRAQEKFAEPHNVTIVKPKVNFKEVKEALKGADKKLMGGVMTFLRNLGQEENASCLKKLDETIEAKGEAELTADDLGGRGLSFKLTRKMLKVTTTKEMKHVHDFIPHVVEPAFGISRILYCLVCQACTVREGAETRTVLKLPPKIAPYTIAVLPLSASNDLQAHARKLHAELRADDVSSWLDASSAAIGRRYVRADQAGIPFAITIDFDTLKDGSLTVRERNSMEQVRIPGADLKDLAFQLSHERTVWADLLKAYPKVEAAAEEEPQAKTH